MNADFRTGRWLMFVVLALGTLAACAGGQRREPLLEKTLWTYAERIRWGEFERALIFMDPERPELEPSALERQRWQHIKISAYREQPPIPQADGTILQVVHIELYNVHSLANRSTVDRQVWRWEPSTKKWYNTTGLPRFDRDQP